MIGKKWTVVIELTDTSKEQSLSQHDLESGLSLALETTMPAECGFRVMEVIEAPYGPQTPEGVVLVGPRIMALVEKKREGT